jgi:hypothetical protein
VNDKEMEFLTDLDIKDDNPFVSKCGMETNFIRPAATPYVFHAFSPAEGTLIFGGNLGQAFDSSRLAISSSTGRLYHGIDTKGKTKSESATEYGLIRSSVAVTLSENISEGPNDKFLYDGFVEIDWLPDENEAGAWAMPDDGSVG